MPDTIESLAGKKQKSSADKWDEYNTALLEQLKRELENPDFDIEKSNTVKKIIAVVSHTLGVEYQQAKMIVNEWLRKDGITDLTKATKPGWKSATSLSLSTLLKVASAGFEAIVPIGGLTGGAAGGVKLAANIAGAGGGAGDGITNMMHSLESSKQTALNFGIEMAKRTAEDNRDSSRKMEDFSQRQIEAERRESEERFRTVEKVL